MNALGDWVVVSSSGQHRPGQNVLTHSSSRQGVRSSTMADSEFVQVEPSLLKEVRRICMLDDVSCLLSTPIHRAARLRPRRSSGARMLERGLGRAQLIDKIALKRAAVEKELSGLGKAPKDIKDILHQCRGFERAFNNAVDVRCHRTRCPRCR